MGYPATEDSILHSHQCRLGRMRMGTKDNSTPNLDRVASSLLQGGWKSEIYPCLLHGEGTSYFCRRRVEIRILPLAPRPQHGGDSYNSAHRLGRQGSSPCCYKGRIKTSPHPWFPLMRHPLGWGNHIFFPVLATEQGSRRLRSFCPLGPGFFWHFG